MRIISKFKDYYDSVQAYGQDHELVFLRQQSEHQIFRSLDNGIKPLPHEFEKYLKGVQLWKKTNFRGGVIGFCGKLIPYIHYEYYEKDYLPKVHHIIYDYSVAQQIYDKIHPSKKSTKRKKRWLGLGSEDRDINSAINILKRFYAQHAPPVMDDVLI